MARTRSHTRRQARSNPRGILSVKREGYGFVATAEGEYFIPQSRMRGAFDGDLVEIAVSHSNKERSGVRADKPGQMGRKRMASVVRVVERAHEELVGRYEVAEPFGVVVPEDPRIPYDIFTQRSANPDIPDGAIVRVRITTYPSRREAACGVVVDVLGDMDDERVPIDLIVARYKLKTEFSSAALDEAASCTVDEDGALAEGYRDLRNRFVFTVDPADARDFDDAVSVEPAVEFGEGALRLGVHIADVAHYVPWQSSIDLEARARATSVYLVDRVIPMLPERLSNDICSLRPGEVRRTMTVDMVMDAAGHIVQTEAFPALIRLRARLSYDEVQQMLDESEEKHAAGPSGQSSEAATLRGRSGTEDCLSESACRFASSGPSAWETAQCAVSSEAGRDLISPPLHTSSISASPEQGAGAEADCPDGPAACSSSLSYDEIVRRVRQLSVLAKQRRALRVEAGGIEFETIEAKVRLDESGAPVDIDLRQRTDATGLIEEAMIAANEAVARLLSEAGSPCLYRVHEPPARENLAGLVYVFGEFPWFKDIDADLFAAGNPHQIMRALDACTGRPEAGLVTTLALRAMKRAIYSNILSGHYALAEKAYVHFTSPIRRYPDLVVHRMLKALIGRRPELFDQEVSALAWLSEHCSEMERTADRAARDSQEAKIVELMEAHVGEKMSAMVVGVATYGLFVRLENTAEGMIETSDLGREYFSLDPLRHTLTGSDSGRTFRLGQHVAVWLVEADRRTRLLRFKLV